MEDVVQKPEGMAEFFNARAVGYDDHMRETVISFDKYYSLISDPVAETQEAVNILDLGCGTGLELKGIFRKAPNANITGIDMSPEMLNELKRKYKDHLDRLNLVNSSYTGIDLGYKKYDYVVSVMTIHHLLYDKKLELYRKIRECLKPGGMYIEGDYTVSPEKEIECLNEYERSIAAIADKTNGSYHIDIPFCIDTQFRLLKEAGFKNFDVLFKEGEAAIVTAVV